MDRISKVPSLRKKQKSDKNHCLNCNFYKSKMINSRCGKWDIQVKHDELCDSHHKVILTGELNEYTEEQFGDLKTYQKLSKHRTNGVVERDHYIPKPTAKDYRDGVIVRRFVQNKSHPNNPVIEVATYGQYPFMEFNQVELDWKINIDDSDRFTKSIFEFNLASTKYASKKMPKLSSFLKNYMYLVKKKI